MGTDFNCTAEFSTFQYNGPLKLLMECICLQKRERIKERDDLQLLRETNEKRNQ